MICLWAYEFPNTFKNPTRTVGVLCENRFFFVEENQKASRCWSEKAYTVWHLARRNPFNTQNVFIDRERVAEANTIMEAKRAILKWIEKTDNIETESEAKSLLHGTRYYGVKGLTSGDASDFFPTPPALAGKMLACVDWRMVESILEPSAGKGNLVTAVECMVESRKYQKHSKLSHGLTENPRACFDVLETDYNLRLILRGMELRLVDDDFLHFNTNKRYDLCLMNPPFSEGAKHLIHAISLMWNGGQICCLLNAETIRNPYTNERRLLQKLLIENHATIQFVKDAFKMAERKSNVEVAIIYINIPVVKHESQLFRNAQKAAEIEIEEQRLGMDDQLVVSDYIEQMITFFNAEAKAGIELLKTYDELVPHIMNGNDSYSKPLLEICVDGHSYESISNNTVNQYMKKLRYKYWKLFLARPELQNKMTSSISAEYQGNIREMSEYDFNRHNIAQVLFDIASQLRQGVEDEIMHLFEKLTSKSCLENVQNIHYYTGWKTNKAHAVGMKVILPINGFAASYSWCKGKLDEYRIFGDLNDLEKCLSYLDKGEIGISYDIAGSIRTANANDATKLSLSYFDVRFYKKGTAHITFHPEVQTIIERLNIFAGRKNNWLPPCYGKKRYADMSEEERTVIDSFQGEDAYNEVVRNPAKYVLERDSLQPMLTA